MPSLDIKSEIDSHELLNAIDQANRVINNRFDFKGTDSKFTLDDEEITLNSQEEFQINQNQWKSLEINGDPLGIIGIRSKSQEIVGNQWKSIGNQ